MPGTGPVVAERFQRTVVDEGEDDLGTVAHDRDSMESAAEDDAVGDHGLSGLGGLDVLATFDAIVGAEWNQLFVGSENDLRSQFGGDKGPAFLLQFGSRHLFRQRFAQRVRPGCDDFILIVDAVAISGYMERPLLAGEVQRIVVFAALFGAAQTQFFDQDGAFKASQWLVPASAICRSRATRSPLISTVPASRSCWPVQSYLS